MGLPESQNHKRSRWGLRVTNTVFYTSEHRNHMTLFISAWSSRTIRVSTNSIGILGSESSGLGTQSAAESLKGARDALVSHHVTCT
jgi:ribose 5-phosphate isomerase RpiB